MLHSTGEHRACAARFFGSLLSSNCLLYLVEGPVLGPKAKLIDGLSCAVGLFPNVEPRRCARTVAWLEFLAGEALESEHQAPLASSDGVWADTRRRLDAAAASRGFAGRDAGEGRVGQVGFGLQERVPLL